MELNFLQTAGSFGEKAFLKDGTRDEGQVSLVYPAAP